MKKYAAIPTMIISALLAVPASAFLDGDAIDIRYLFPDVDTVFQSASDVIIDAGTEVTCPGDSLCSLNFNNVFMNFIDIDPVQDTLTIDWNGGAGFTTLNGFNGFEFAQLDEAIAEVFVQCVRTNGEPCDPVVTFGTSPTSGNYLRINYGGFSPATNAAMMTVTVSSCAADLDTDGDSITDSVDNCLFAANTDQTDADGDGFGNECDQDINNDGIVNFLDLGELRLAFFSTPGSANWEPGADFNNDNVVNVIDLGKLRVGFFNAPGPSCALGSQ